MVRSSHESTLLDRTDHIGLIGEFQLTMLSNMLVDQLGSDGLTIIFHLRKSIAMVRHTDGPSLDHWNRHAHGSNVRIFYPLPSLSLESDWSFGMTMEFRWWSHTFMFSRSHARCVNQIDLYCLIQWYAFEWSESSIESYVQVRWFELMNDDAESICAAR